VIDERVEELGQGLKLLRGQTVHLVEAQNHRPRTQRCHRRQSDQHTLGGGGLGESDRPFVVTGAADPKTGGVGRVQRLPRQPPQRRERCRVSPGHQESKQDVTDIQSIGPRAAVVQSTIDQPPQGRERLPRTVRLSLRRQLRHGLVEGLSHQVAQRSRTRVPMMLAGHLPDHRLDDMPRHRSGIGRQGAEKEEVGATRLLSPAGEPGEQMALAGSGLAPDHQALVPPHSLQFFSLSHDLVQLSLMNSFRVHGGVCRGSHRAVGEGV
jgi:hypothetical protein